MVTDPVIKVTFYGVRGSIGVGGFKYHQTGERTTCIGVRVTDSPQIIFDAGTGIYPLGCEIDKRIKIGKNPNPLDTRITQDKSIHIFWTHGHGDHMDGFNMTAASFFNGQNQLNLNLYCPIESGQSLKQLLQDLSKPKSFPLSIDKLSCQKRYHDLAPDGSSPAQQIGLTSITSYHLRHPSETLGYCVQVGNKKVVLAADNEIGETLEEGLVNFAQGADILICDAQYTAQEYESRVGHGHSTPEKAVKFALEARAKKLLLTHHDPKRDDRGVMRILRGAQRFRDQQTVKQYQDQSLTVLAARQDMVLEL